MEFSYGYRLRNEYVQTLIYSLVGFFLPFFMGHPQLIVGIVVNSMLIMGSLNVRGYKLLPIIIAPSLGVLSRGLIFGPYTIYLIYMIPFIWIGNSIIVAAFKSKGSFIVKLIAGSAAKSGFLFLSAFLLFKLGLLPVMFLTAMGLIQLATAIGGGILAYGLQKLSAN